MSPVTQILQVFTSLTEWFASTVDSAEAIFWDDSTGLTFVGTLSAVGVAIAVTILIANWIKGFIHLR